MFSVEMETVTTKKQKPGKVKPPPPDVTADAAPAAVSVMETDD